MPLRFEFPLLETASSHPSHCVLPTRRERSGAGGLGRGLGGGQRCAGHPFGRVGLRSEQGIRVAESSVGTGRRFHLEKVQAHLLCPGGINYLTFISTSEIGNLLFLDWPHEEPE